MNPNETLSKFIKNYRKEANLTLNELSHEIGVPRSTIGDAENADRGTTLSTLGEIADGFHIAPSELIAEESSPEKLTATVRLMNSLQLYTELSEEDRRLVADHIDAIVKITTAKKPDTTPEETPLP